MAQKWDEFYTETTRGRERMHGQGLPKRSTPSVSISMEAVRHMFSPKSSIANTSSLKAVKARALVVEDNAVMVLPEVLVA
jgi:hypothetical protein